MKNDVDALVEAFENLTLTGVEALGAIYAPDARFIDPFNDVRGLSDIQRIFRHMYQTLENPRFIITARIAQDRQCFLAWEYRFSFIGFKKGQKHCILGGTHLLLNSSGRITSHRDYWDAAGELYEKLPVVGGLMRWLKRKIQS